MPIREPAALGLARNLFPLESPLFHSLAASIIQKRVSIDEERARAEELVALPSNVVPLWRGR